MGLAKRGYTLRPLTAKVLGKDKTREYPAGSRCWFERTPNAPGLFMVWFTKPGRSRSNPTVYAQIPAIDLLTTIQEA